MFFPRPLGLALWQIDDGDVDVLFSDGSLSMYKNKKESILNPFFFFEYPSF